MTPQRLNELIAEVLRQHGQQPVTGDSACLERSIGAAVMLEQYADEHNRLLFAVGLLYYLALNHCYLDGNKRVAWMAMQDALRELGVHVCASDVEAENTVLAVATRRMGRDELADWVANHISASTT